MPNRSGIENPQFGSQQIRRQVTESRGPERSAGDYGHI
jgi:hypothetical protein